MPNAGKTFWNAMVRSAHIAVAGALLVCASAGQAIAEEKVVHLSSLDWPPFAGPGLPGGGATTEVIRAAFETAGYKIKVSYHTWPKAIANARKGIEGVVAYYPGYHCQHRSGFIASRSIGTSPLGFAEHIEAPLVWDTLDDIGERKLKIGTVQGYTNTDEFDAKVGTGWIHAIPSKTDTVNLKKLLRKRIDAAVIDRFVFTYLTRRESSLNGHGGKLRFNEKLLENKTFHLCFRSDETNSRILREFDKGLERLDGNRIVEDYIAATFQD